MSQITSFPIEKFDSLKTGAQVDDAVDKRHAQNTDTELDSGGPNAITAAEIKAAAGLAGTALQPGDFTSTPAQIDAGISLANTALQAVIPTDLTATNVPADGQVPTYDNATGNFTWAAGGGAEVNIYNATALVADWTGTDPVTATLTVTGMLATDTPIVDIDLSSVLFADVTTQQNEWSKVYRAESLAGQIKLYATAAPTVDLATTIKVVR